MADIEDTEITLSSLYDPPIQEKVWRARRHIAECRGASGRDKLCVGCAERVAAIAVTTGGEKS